MARVLIVGCGCRGRALARELRAAGHMTRGTTRDPERLDAIEDAADEAVVADPDRLGTIVAQLPGVSVVCWLLGSANGDPDEVAALHGPRLRSLLEALVDSPARGFVYEGAGDVAADVLERGAEEVRGAGKKYRMPVEIVGADPSNVDAWVGAGSTAVERVLED